MLILPQMFIKSDKNLLRFGNKNVLVLSHKVAKIPENLLLITTILKFKQKTIEKNKSLY